MIHAASLKINCEHSTAVGFFIFSRDSNGQRLGTRCTDTNTYIYTKMSLYSHRFLVSVKLGEVTDTEKVFLFFFIYSFLYFNESWQKKHRNKENVKKRKEKLWKVKWTQFQNALFLPLDFILHPKLRPAI